MIKISQAIIVKSGDITKNYVDKKLNLKVDKVEGKGLSTEDFLPEEKVKLSNIENNATRTIISQNVGTSETIVMSQKAVTEAISHPDIPIASKGKMPTTGIDISELDVTKEQWLRKIVFNETFTIPSSASLKLKCKDLSGTYSIYFSSTDIEIYNNNGSTEAMIYYSGLFKDSLTTTENITWDAITRTLSFDKCIYQFTIDNSSSDTISSLTNVGKIYLDTINGATGVFSPIDIRQMENQNSLVPTEGKSDSIGMTQKAITYALKDLRNKDLAIQNGVVSSNLINFTNWDLVLLSNNLASHQAARYSNGTTFYGKMVLEYDSNTKNVIMRAIYKQSSISVNQVKTFTFKNLINNNSPEFLLYADTSHYYIIDMKTRNVYRGNISVNGVPSETITQISTLPDTIPAYTAYYYLRILSVNGLLYIIKTNSSGGAWTTCVSADQGETWHNIGVEANKVNFVRYVDGIYYMGIYLSSASPNYAILSSTDGINFTDLHASNPEIYDVVYDSSNNIWYGLAFSSWMSGSSIGEMSKVSNFTMHGNMLCRFSASYPLGVMGFNNGGNYLKKIYVTKDCITSEDSKQTFSEINGNPFYTYQPLEVSSTNTNITTIMKVNGNYYLGELKNYSGQLNLGVSIPSEICLPSFPSTGTYSLKVVNGKIQWVKD